jgi:cell division protein FtsB
MVKFRKFVKDLAIPKKLFISCFISFSAIFYFSSYALFGNKGVVKYFQLRRELQEKVVVRDNLHHEMQDKKNMVSAMNINSLDVDLLDEQVRKNLGYAGKEEIIIYDNKSRN